MNARSPVVISIIFAGLFLTSCAEKGVDRDPAADAAAASVDQIATEFVDAYFAQFPEEVYEVGYPGAPMDRFGDHGTANIAAWNERVDSWLEQLDNIDGAALKGRPAELTYDFARERMQAIAARRVCKMDWWNISPTWTGWQYQLISTLAVQPVLTAEEKSDALARIADVARYIETEIEILREGMQNDYLAASSNIAAVLRQTGALIATPTEESPFFDPAKRSEDTAFADQYKAILELAAR